MFGIEQVFCESIFQVYRRQMSLLDQIGDGDFQFDMATASLKFSNGQQWATQAIGLETRDGVWMWAWVEDESLPREYARFAQQICLYGLENSIGELTVPKLNTGQLGCGGHTLAAIASSVGSSPYFVCPNDQANLFVLISDSQYPSALPPISAAEVCMLMPQMFADYAISDHRLAIQSALSANQFEIQSTAEFLKGTKDGASVVCSLDAEGQVVNIATE